MKSDEGMLTRMSNVISIVVTILGLLGIYFKPQNTNFIIIGVGIVILLIYMADKISQVDENTEQIKELHKKLDIDKKLHILETEVAEQKGKLSMVVNKK